MSFKNFKIWRGKLPHWRADDVTYYAAFRHSRGLDEREREILFAHLLKPDSKKYELLALCVLPEASEIIFQVLEDQHGPIELSKTIEAAKVKAGRQIIKKSGEPFPPFYRESYDRIIRDEAELEQRMLDIIGSPEREGLTAGEYACLYVKSP